MSVRLKQSVYFIAFLFSALALGLSAAFNAPIPEARFGVFRM